MATTTPWWDGPHAGFDLETTGINTANDRIVTANITQLIPPGYDTTPAREQLEQAQLVPTTQWAVETQDWLVDPGVEIPAGATAKHGITTEYARRNGQQPKQAIEGILDRLYRLLSNGNPIVGMNLAYDFTLLHFECLRHGIPTLSESLGREPSPLIDIYVLDKEYVPRRSGKRTLTDLARIYQVRQDTAHTSAGDVLTSLRVARKMVLQHHHLASIDPVELHNLQRVWRAGQCSSLQRYFSSIRKRNPDGTPIQIDTCWPVCTDPNHPRG
jgi:DNA polymerase-3 subunit epsilon